MAEASFKQDLPPKGGYAPINYKRIPARRVLNAPLIYGGLIASMAIGQYSYRKGWTKWTAERVELRSAELALEPLMLAERDREFLKQCRRNRDYETELMKDVEGWEVGTWYGHKIYKTTGEKWIDPDINEFYVHTSPRQQKVFGNHAMHLRTE
jgi:NADH dehydrogenase (ubiquinone) 1 alpha subcomplex subunit 13